MSMEFQFLTTKRLKLRMITPEVFNYIFQTYTEDEIKSFLNTKNDTDYQKWKLKYEKGITGYNRSFLLFQLIDKTSNQILGGCGYHNWFAEHSRSEIGYDLHDDAYKRNGYMSEALEAIIAYGFTSMNLNRIEACIGPQNIASRKLIEKMNFKQEGILKEHFCSNGIIGDSIIYALLKRDYNQ